MSNKQQKYNEAIDNISYLVLNYPKPVQELLAEYNVFFQGKPSKEQLINEIVELLKDGNTDLPLRSPDGRESRRLDFATAIEQLIQKFAAQENDQFLNIVKGAVGILGGLFKKKKRRSGGSSNAAAAQAAAAKRDMEMRMQRMREEQERRRREAEERRRREEERRKREEAERRRREEAAKKKTNMMLMIGGGVVVLGIGAVVLMKSNRPQMPYGQPSMQIPR